MDKRLGRCILYIFAFFIAAVLFFLVPAKVVSDSFGCAFCNKEILCQQKFYEDELVYALYTHKPITPGHCLVIPKRHVERFEMLNDEEALQLFQVLKKVHRAASKVFNSSSYLVLQKNGMEAGQTVPHVHFHYIPRKEGENSIFRFFFQMYISILKSPMKREEMGKVIEELKLAMSQEEHDETYTKFSNKREILH